MAYQLISVDRADRVVTVTLKRPEVKNAINKAMVAELHDAFDELRDDTDVGCVILTGQGDDFAAGADIVFVPGVLDRTNIDRLVGVWDEDAYRTKRLLAMDDDDAWDVIIADHDLDGGRANRADAVLIAQDMIDRVDVGMAEASRREEGAGLQVATVWAHRDDRHPRRYVRDPGCTG